MLAAIAASVAVLTTGCDKALQVTAEVATGAAGIHEAVASQANDDLARDALVAARVTQALRGDPTTGAAKIYVSVSDGHTRLSGFVDTAAERLRAGVLASETEGVEGVDNRLILRYHADMSQDPLGGARVRL